MASFRFHPRFPNLPLTQKVLQPQDAGTRNCDLCNVPILPGDTIWSNRDQDIDILDIAMPPSDIRFHDIAPKVPLVKYQLTAETHQQIGPITCDVSKKVTRVGDWLWGNRNQNIDILDQAMPSTVAMPTPSTSFETVDKGFSSGICDGQNRVIKDLTEWGHFWAMHQSLSYPPPPLPAVDFQRYMVICVNAGTKKYGGHAIEVKSAETRGVNGAQLVIGVETSSPPPGSVTTMAITQPYHIVKVPRMVTPVAFEAVAPGNGSLAPLQPIAPLLETTAMKEKIDKYKFLKSTVAKIDFEIEFYGFYMTQGTWPEHCRPPPMHVEVPEVEVKLETEIDSLEKMVAAKQAEFKEKKTKVG